MAYEPSPEEKAKDFERLLLLQQLKMQGQVVDMYTSVINQISGLASLQNMPTGVFKLSKLRTLDNLINQLITKLNKNFEVTVKSGIGDAWKLSNDKNDFYADIRLNKSRIPTDIKLKFYDPNLPAMRAFQTRQVNGLNLSERIYKTGEIFKSELEAGVGVGISKGQSAAEMGRDLRQYLKDPDKLFRRVRDEEGNLQLSKNAKAFHPGTGTYRSSRANIERLTRTETNMAYQTADSNRWANMPFVVGQEIKLSNNHPKYDVCDILQGEYPVEFQFISWHPNCLCFVVPKLMSDAQFIAYQKLVLNGEDTPANVHKITGRVMTIPNSAAQWMEDNKQKIAGYKNPPLWWQKNEQFVPELPPPLPKE